MNIQQALADGGKIVASGALVAGFLLGNVTGEQIQPVDSITPNSPAVEAFNPCPSGWDFHDDRVGDSPRITCVKAPWVVVLNPDFTFNYGLDTANPNGGEVQNPQRVPGWQ